MIIIITLSFSHTCWNLWKTELLINIYFIYIREVKYKQTRLEKVGRYYVIMMTTFNTIAQELYAWSNDKASSHLWSTVWFLVLVTTGLAVCGFGLGDHRSFCLWFWSRWPQVLLFVVLVLVTTQAGRGKQLQCPVHVWSWWPQVLLSVVLVLVTTGLAVCGFGLGDHTGRSG